MKNSNNETITDFLLTSLITLVNENVLSTKEERDVNPNIIKAIGRLILFYKLSKSYENDFSTISEVNLHLFELVDELRTNQSLTRSELIKKLILKFNNDEGVKAVVIENTYDCSDEFGITAARKEIVEGLNKLKSMIVKTNIVSTLSDSLKNLNNTNDPKKDHLIVSNLKRSMLLHDFSNTADSGFVRDIDFTKKEDVEAMFERSITSHDNKQQKFKTGWKRLNRMLGGGLRRGTFTMINGLEHNYKSGMLLTLFRQLLEYNKPIITEDKKRPTMIFIPLEDKVNDVIKFIYLGIVQEKLKHKENKNELLIEATRNYNKLNPVEVASYIRDKYKKLGWDVLILEADLKSFSLDNLERKLTEINSSGRDINFLMIDYFSLATPDERDPALTRSIFIYLKQYCQRNNIGFVTPHQISPAGKKAYTETGNKFDYVKNIAKCNYTSGSTKLSQDADNFIHICNCVNKLNKKSYLTIGWTKTKHEVISEKDKYIILPYGENKHLPIKDDFNDEDEMGYSTERELTEEILAGRTETTITDNNFTF